MQINGLKFSMLLLWQFIQNAIHIKPNCILVFSVLGENKLKRENIIIFLSVLCSILILIILFGLLIMWKRRLFYVQAKSDAANKECYCLSFQPDKIQLNLSTAETTPQKQEYTKSSQSQQYWHFTFIRNHVLKMLRNNRSYRSSLFSEVLYQASECLQLRFICKNERKKEKEWKQQNYLYEQVEIVFKSNQIKRPCFQKYMMLLWLENYSILLSGSLFFQQAL